MAPSIANDGTEAINCEACSDSSSDSHQYHPNRDNFCKHRHYTINLRFPVNLDLSMLTVLRLLRHASGGGLEQIQFLLGYVSVQTTEHLGCKRRIRSAVNDRIGVEPNP